MRNSFWFVGFAIWLIGCSSEEVKRDRFFLQGNVAIENREFKQAIKYFTSAIQIDQNFSAGYNNRGVAYIEDDHPYEAIQDYNMALSLNDDYIDARFNRAYAYESVGRFEDALEDIGKLKEDFQDSAYVHFYEGILLSNLKSYDQAMLSFNRSLDLDPDNLETLVNISTLYYFQGDYQLALAKIDEVLAIEPTEANALNTLSQVRLQQKKYPEALDAINKALAIEQGEPYFLNNRGQIYLEMDSLALAVNDINQSIVIDPKNMWAYRNKGIYFLIVGDPAQAIRLFDRVVASSDFVDEVYSYFGEAYYAQGQLTEACGKWQEGSRRKESRSKMLSDLYCD